MATTGKSKRKTKGKTYDLQSFLSDNQEAPDGFAVVTTPLNWADCSIDDDEDRGIETRRDTTTIPSKVVLPTVPKSARTPDFDLSKVPTRPPYKAYLCNLPYETTEEEIIRFFKKLNVSRVHLVKDAGERGRPRGVGFAEFEDRESLIDALGQNNELLKNRSIRVSLSEASDDRQRRDDKEDRTAGDWRSSARETPITRNGDFSTYDNDSYRGRSSFDRGGDRRPMDRDRNSKGGGGFDRFQRNDRDFGDIRDFNRGPRNDRNFDRGLRDSRGPERSFDDRRGDRSSMGDRNYRLSDKDRPIGRNFSSSSFERRNSGASSLRYSPSPPVSTDSRDVDEQEKREIPKERPKIVLNKRTKPIDNKVNPASSNAAIFGGAKPVDTAAKEREIEEKLAKEKQTI